MAKTATAPFLPLAMDLGPMPSDDCMGGVLSSLSSLRERKELCDVVLTVGTEQFFAHRAVLAAVSPHFYSLLSQPEHVGGDTVALTMDTIRNPEAMQAVLDYIYRPAFQHGAPSSSWSDEVKCDILRLAQLFQIPQLRDEAALLLTKGLSTGNVLQRLRACEEFDLHDARERILEQLTAHPQALFMLASDPEVVQVPAVLQELMVRVLRLLGADKAY
mmetsp:Transcript_33366/g.61197  ORF Transcript_33366/g.61197 Transcript_33366/m.61197 type:complete len:217 (-) Transcript_33366:108-758(-)